MGKGKEHVVNLYLHLMTTLGKQNVGILEVIASCFQALKKLEVSLAHISNQV